MIQRVSATFSHHYLTKTLVFSTDDTLHRTWTTAYLLGWEHPGFGALDIKVRYRGLKYLPETLKMLPQKPETIVIDNIAEHLGAIGAIHYTSPQIRPG